MIGALKRFLNIEDVEKDVCEGTPKKIHLEQKALELSVREGAASEFSVGIGTQYATPFALALKASSLQVGILSSLSGLAAPLASLYGSHLMAHKSRKKIILSFVLLQVLAWLPIVFLGILYMKGILQDYLIYAFIFFFTLYTLFGGIVGPPWFSWMGDLVPEQDRGRYFATRNKVAGAAGIVAALIGAFILDYFETKGLVLIGFSILFSLTFTFRLISFFYLRKQYAPKFRVKKSSYFSLVSFVKRFDNYGKYVFYKMFFYFAIMFASPFFAVYMLQELHFSYLVFMIITMSSSVFYLIFTPIVGRFSDRFGNVRLIYLANFFFVLSPLCWLFFKSPIALLFIPQLISGLANATLVLGSTNFTYSSVNQQHRGICIAYENLFIGVGTFAGSLLGGFLLKYSSSFTAFNAFFVMFVLAGVLRLVVGIIFLPMIKEEKKTEKLPAFHLSLAHPFKTIHADIARFRAIMRKKKPYKTL